MSSGLDYPPAPQQPAPVFSSLPLEIRREIWKHYYADHKYTHNDQYGIIGQTTTSHLPLSKQFHHESHEAMLQHGTLVLLSADDAEKVSRTCSVEELSRIRNIDIYDHSLPHFKKGQTPVHDWSVLSELFGKCLSLRKGRLHITSQGHDFAVVVGMSPKKAAESNKNQEVFKDKDGHEYNLSPSLIASSLLFSQWTKDHYADLVNAVRCLLYDSYSYPGPKIKWTFYKIGFVWDGEWN